MKKHIPLILGVAAALAVQAVQAKEASVWTGGNVEDFTANRDGNTMTVGMDVDAPSFRIKSNRAVLLRPVLSNGADSVALPPVALYGRRRYIYYRRNFAGTMLGGADESVIRGHRLDSVYRYERTVPYADWMDGATLAVHEEEYGCCRELLNRTTLLFPGIYHNPLDITAWMPELAYIWPDAVGEKTDSLEGRAYVQFPVDRTEIKEDFRNNYFELAKIRGTIDSVRNDRDIVITGIWLKGYASPESPYAHNSDLAQGRVAAVKEYVQRLCDIEGDVISTEFEPEDWEGLRAFVVETNLPNRDAILELIDTDMDPDKKEQLIKRRYPADYKFLLEHSYPALRHTDYRVSYKIKRFTDLEEIKRVLRDNPSKLDLNEIYLLARSMEPGTHEYNDLFETAVRLFPHDATANLNAANAALQQGNLEQAAARLEKAGDSPEADYTRGVLAVKRGDDDEAEALLLRAAERGIMQAADALQTIRRNKKK